MTALVLITEGIGEVTEWTIVLRPFLRLSQFVE